MNVGIIGGGLAGLSAGHRLVSAGADLTLIEKDETLGGLASSFPLKGGRLERYYHFICRPDRELFSLLEETGLSRRLAWKRTRMGIFYADRSLSFGLPEDLLLFPHLSLAEKARFALGLFKSKWRRAGDWREIENEPASDWLRREFGSRIYEILHEPLIRLKFGRYARELSAAWIWARIHRVGKSRTPLLQREILGYIEGGTAVLVERLAEGIRGGGGRIITGNPVKAIGREGGRFIVRLGDGSALDFDRLISTLPLPDLAPLIPDDWSGPYWDLIRGSRSIGVICVLLRLSRPLTRYFWLNISDPAIPLAGVIEYTNLNPCAYLDGETIVYLPRYCPPDDATFSMTDDAIIGEFSGYLPRIIPGFDPGREILGAMVNRNMHAQPLAPVGFSALIPPMAAPVPGLFVTDSTQVLPDDRTLSNSIGLGRLAAKAAMG